MTPATIKKAAMELTARQRRALARSLWKSVDDRADADLDLELDRRLLLLDAHPEQGIPMDEAFKILDKRLDDRIRKSKHS